MPPFTSLTILTFRLTSFRCEYGLVGLFPSQRDQDFLVHRPLPPCVFYVQYATTALILINEGLADFPASERKKPLMF
jgi:hypothetical protein